MFNHDDDLIIHNNPATFVRADARRNHRLVLEAAARLFARFGVEAVSMTQIAQEAGVGKGTLYRNFPNKISLCYALLDQEQRDLQEATLRRLRQKISPQENLLWFLEQAALFVMRNEALLHAGTDDVQSVSLDIPAHLWWRQTILNLLQQADVVGDVEYFGDTLYALLHVNTIRFQRLSLGYPQVRVIAGLHAVASRLFKDA
jgi:AcrR family transcriptional regulator